MIPTKNKIGIIAGEGELPKISSRNALAEGFEVFAVAVNEAAFRDLSGTYTTGCIIPPAQSQKYSDYYLSRGINEVLVIGKINKLWALSQIPFLDAKARSYLKYMVDFQDNTFHTNLQKMIENEGGALIPQIRFLGDQLLPKGDYGARELSETEKDDLDYGFEMAKRASQLEVSQMVVIKNKAVMAFEAAEGTDETIKRGCQLARRGAVIVKVAWKNQNSHFDLPTIGPRTIETIARHRGAVMAIESNTTFVIDLPKTQALVKRHGIAFLSI
ncbi:MAG: UDP-2,3-diacylglucosamine diphosphatase LpxI [Candidatus Caenarcaniphilales bacterium]|nr:UDP-2,3-diacylglucosamine diphosphatase LpxI [Candidatus Caenarcaniphilales bacterium]